MGKNEKTSKEMATLAAKILAGKKATKKEILSLAAGVLTQTPDKRKKKNA